MWLAANKARGRRPPTARQARVREKLADPAALSIVAMHDGRIAGMALGEAGRHADGAGPPDPLLLHVSMVFVHPAFWGRGTGRALLGTMFDEARREGYERTTLWTAAENDRARRLYTRLGLRETGRSKTIASYGVVLQFGTDLDLREDGRGVELPRR